MSPLVLESEVAKVETETRPMLTLSDFFQLTKARLTLLVLVTTVAGFYLGSVGPVSWVRLLWTLLGTGCVAGAAAVLNQLRERETDRLMQRTADRPLVTGRVHPDVALALGVGLTAVGMGVFVLTLDLSSAVLAAATLALYLFIYTPLKQLTTLNTAVGAIPGAIPPVIGWTAAAGGFEPSSLWLFALLYFWQMPHFLAIAWMYREDYAKAGMKMLPCEDPECIQTSMQSLLNAVALIPVSLIPIFFGQVGVWAFGAALLLGVGYAGMAFLFFQKRDEITARRLFLASITYLPLVLLALALNKQ